jgi:hypothetical protein
MEARHPRLVHQLKGFEPFETMSLVAGLLTQPDFHANTVRLEVLQNLILRNAAGDAVPKRNRLEQWLNQELLTGEIGQLEDPVEDVFISNVITSYGNNRIFEGIWEANDFWAQESIATLNTMSQRAEVQSVMDRCSALLRLSECVADRCGLERYHSGGGEPRKILTLPDQSKLTARGNALWFSSEDLVALKIATSHLSPFIHRFEPATGSFGKSSLDKAPLLEHAGKMFLAVPAAISVAVRVFIAEQMLVHGLLGIFEELLASRQATRVFKEGRLSLGGEMSLALSLPAPPVGSRIAGQGLVKFDEGRYAHLLFVADSVLEFYETRAAGLFDLTTNERGLAHHCETIAQLIALLPGFTAGMTVLVVGGLGRAFAFAFNPGPNWHLIASQLPDFLSLGRIPETTFLSIWSLHQQQEELTRGGARFINLNGEINLLGYWLKQKERLIPRSVEPRTLIRIPSNALVELRKKSRVIQDYHAIQRRNPKSWVPVRRYISEAYFQEAMYLPIFVDEQAVFKEHLRGAAETNERGWWVSSKLDQGEEKSKDLAYRIWDCFLQWMPKIADIIEANIDELRSGPIEIFVDSRPLLEWSSLNLLDLPPAQELEIVINHQTSVITIRLPLGFIQYFVKTDNIAERKIIRACLEAAVKLSDLDVSASLLDAMVEEIVGNDRARFFHVVTADNFRQYRAPDCARNPLLIRQGHTNSVALGTATRLLTPGSETRASLTTAKDLLHLVVDDCWKRIKALLVTLDLRWIVDTALENIEAIEYDKEQWRMTASALFAIHSDAEDVIQAAGEQEQKRSSAEMASRVLVEMAICTCPSTDGSIAGDYEIGQLLGLINLLMFAARCSDAIQYNFVTEEINVYPNGEFSIDDSYVEQIVAPYIREHFSEHFKQAAEDYHVRGSTLEPQAEESDRRGGFDPVLVSAFQSEFGLSPQELITAETALSEDALRDQSMVVHRTNAELRAIIMRAGLSESSASSFLTQFSLWPRGEWNRAPQGFSNKDWYPWRFRRKLSLVARPLVRLGVEDSSSVYFAPGQIRASVGLLLSRVIEGELAPESFHSALMKSWIGRATQERGVAFEREVGDEMKELGFETRVARPMTEFGADESFGDLDVTAWTQDCRRLYLIEAKSLRIAKTVSEIGEQLREFKGQEKDRLAKHIRRCDWVKTNLGKFAKAAKMKSSPVEIVPMLVTSTLVPMQFVTGLPLEPDSVVSLRHLKSWIAQRQ